MQLISRLLNPLLLCCLIGTTQAATAASVPFTVESDGSYSYFLTGNTLVLSNSSNIITLGGHDANNQGINLISYQNGQFQIGGFFDLNEFNIGNYLSNTGDALAVSTASSGPSITVNSGLIMINGGGSVSTSNFSSITACAGTCPTETLILNTGTITLTSGTLNLVNLTGPTLTDPTLTGGSLTATGELTLTGGTLSGGTLTLAAVPLPPAIALLLSGLALLGYTSRRRAA